jgi:hypothetical protein
MAGNAFGSIPLFGMHGNASRFKPTFGMHGNTDFNELITPNNLLEKASKFYANSLDKQDDIVDTLKSMIASAKYTISKEFTIYKLDLEDTQYKFRILTRPESVTRDEIIQQVFQNHT